jgi:hypothetical protein
MAAIPSKLEPLITMYQLGTVKKIYKPHTISSIILGLSLTIFACVWIIITLMMTGSFLLVTDQSSSQISAIPFSDTATSAPDTGNGILSFIFPLFGLIFIVIGLFVVIKAVLNRDVRAVLCENGVAHLGRMGDDAFRWEQVKLAFDKIKVSTNATNSVNGSISTSRTINHTYTVICKDGRKFVFNNTLNYVEQLGKEIQLAIATYQKSA